VTEVKKIAKQGVGRYKKQISPRKIRIAALLSVMGPGVIAGLSDDDPAGITTYSVLGAKYGYQMLWVLGASTVALILFQDLGARIGVVTRQGLIGLVRQKYGARSGVLSASALILANIGTMAAEFAGIAAAGQLFGYSRYVTVPVAGLLVSFFVLCVALLPRLRKFSSCYRRYFFLTLSRDFLRIRIGVRHFAGWLCLRCLLLMTPYLSPLQL
jgi:Mn2+/Fe2+ NRAMP family transporter